jgi:outer membrane protein OmpA-like peptidoglycan-associated protein
MLFVFLAFSQQSFAEIIETPRLDTLALLRSLKTQQGIDLKAWINDGMADKLKIGDELVFRFKSDQDCYLTIVHVDGQGALTVVKPELDSRTNLLPKNTLISYPNDKNTFSLEIKPPLGEVNVFVYATGQPLTEENLDQERDGFLEIGPEFANEYAKQLGAALKASPSSGKMAASEIFYRVMGRTGEVTFIDEDIISYFKAKRSIKRPTMILDDPIEFAFGSAELTPSAKKKLDTWGRSLSSPVLRSKKFIIGGHTDDVGTEPYKLQLSQQRAEAVKDYLIENFDIPSYRLDTKAFGEARPLLPYQTDEARKANRRVEFQN